MVGLGNLHNPLGQGVLTLGQDNGGVIPLRLVAQRHGKVGGVSDDHIRAGDLLHHAPLGPLPLNLLDFPLYLGVAFHLLVFFLDLLLGHLHLPLIVPLLVQEIRTRQGHKGHGYAHNHTRRVLHQMKG